MTFRVITGESPRLLLDQLDAVMADHPLPPLADDIVIVQSLGMERWLRQQLARRRGVAASLLMPFPAAFCRRLALDLQAAPPDPGFDEQALLWRIHALLQDPALTGHALLGPLHRTLASPDPVVRFQLARRITARFDEYRLYRPALLLGWEAAGEPPVDTQAAWQWLLWRRLVHDAASDGSPPRHFARWLTETITQLEDGQVDATRLPPRVALFGISTLAPVFVRLLRALARHIPVTCHVFTPSGSGWRGFAHRHPLEEAFGHTTRELLAELTEATGTTASSSVVDVVHVGAPSIREIYPGGSLLAQLQQAIRTGASDAVPAPAERTVPLLEMTPENRSLLIHDCHSPRRELEVLRDQLLDAMAADPSLRPDDVLVMVPDVERYAALAPTALAHAGTEGIVLRVRVADRSLARDVAPAQALLQLLDLVGSRLLQSTVLDFLSLDVVRTAAELSPDALELATRLIAGARIRWGRDAAQRGEGYAGPAFPDGSWQWGVDRLMAGYAMGPAADPGRGGLPAAGDTGSSLSVLGLLVEWTERLLDTLHGLETPRSLAAWGHDLAAAYRAFVRGADDTQVRAVDRVAAVCEQLAARQGSAPVPFPVVRSWVQSMLGASGLEGGFLAGGVTLCAMKPMRAVPFRFIAVLGLDDRSFPRQERRAASDLIARTPQRGDRDPRADDRQLFLDTLLCAEDRLHLSWVGRSERTNRPVAPSVVLAELLDDLPPRVREQVVVSHPLQPFSPRYFDAAGDPRLCSHHPAWTRAVQAAVTRVEPSPFLLKPPEESHTGLPRPEGDTHPVSLESLIACWQNPARFHCRDVLGLWLPRGEELPSDHEAIALDPFTAVDLMAPWLREALRGALDADRTMAALRAGGALPPAAFGAAIARTMMNELVSLVDQVGPVVFMDPRVVEVTGPGWVLAGRLDHLTPSGPLLVRTGRLWTHDRVAAWITHLVWSALTPGDASIADTVRGTRLMGIEKGAVINEGFAWEPDAMRHLDRLISGLHQAYHAPIPYFTRAAEAYHGACKPGARTAPRDAAKKGYEGAEGTGRSRTPGDRDDRHVRLLWRGRHPIDEEFPRFAVLADALWVPMEEAKARWAHQQVAGGGA